MKLLVLDFTPSHGDIKQVLKSREWECVWLNALDINSVCERLRSARVDMALILDSPSRSQEFLVKKLHQELGSLPIVYKSEKRIDLHELLGDLEAGFARLKQKSAVENTDTQKDKKLELDPRFFKSIDLYHVIDRMFSFFGHKLLCEDIHWIAHNELPHFLNQEIKELKLELEVDYKRSHRLKSLNENNPIEVVKWLRELPFAKVDLSHAAVFNEGTGTHLWYPLYDQGKPLGSVLLKGLEVENIEVVIDAIEDDIKMISRFLSFALQMWEAQSLAIVDDLTELHNQRYLPRVVDREMARADRIGKKFTVLFIDVDYFKKVNDSNGHWVGSHLLVELAKIFKSGIRSCDYAFRYGGDEFVLVLVDSDAAGSQIVAERLRQKIESTTFEVEGRSLNLTVSIGLACYPDHAQSRQDIIELADQAMYYGKNKSRNIVYVAS